jgi:glucose/mannose-6-phosphate isomerase
MSSMNKLDDAKELAQIDRSGMREMLLGFPEQLSRAWGLQAEVPQFKQIVVCGMGGSAIGGDCLKVYLARKGFPRPVFVVRGYELPPFVDEDTVVFAVSYSGNTEETLQCFAEALKRGCPIVAMTSGGRLARMALEHGTSLISIPKGLPPRAAFGYLFLPMLRSLEPYLQGLKGEFQGALEKLQRIAPLYAEAPQTENPAKRLARAWHGRIPVIYGSYMLTDVVARRWKTQINENAEAPAFHNALPELHHNELMVWGSLRERFVYTLLRDPAEGPKLKRRSELTRSLLEERGCTVLEFRGEGEGLLARLLSLSHLGDWASFYLAMLYGVDPTPVTLIEELKARLSR